MLSTTERRELEAHRTHLRVAATLGNIRQRLELLEKPKPTVQDRQQDEQQARIDRFWNLAEEEQQQNPQLSASQCRQRVLAANPDLRTIYPMLRS